MCNSLCAIGDICDMSETKLLFRLILSLPKNCLPTLINDKINLRYFVQVVQGVHKKRIFKPLSQTSKISFFVNTL